MMHTVYYNNLQTPFYVIPSLSYYLSRNCNYPAAMNETPVLALNYISLLIWRVLLMVKYGLTILNIGFTKNNAE